MNELIGLLPGTFEQAPTGVRTSNPSSTLTNTSKAAFRIANTMGNDGSITVGCLWSCFDIVTVRLLLRPCISKLVTGEVICWASVSLVNL